MDRQDRQDYGYLIRKVLVAPTVIPACAGIPTVLP